MRPRTKSIYFSVFLGIVVLNQEEKTEIPVPVKEGGTLPCDSCSPCSPAPAPAPPSPSLEAPTPLFIKDTVESPAKKQPKKRVRLAANFSFAPITKL